MEIVIDLDTVRRVTSSEYAQASSDIANVGVLRAYERSRTRHDTRLRSALDSHLLACEVGCAWCCHFSVDVRAVEVFVILQFMQQHFSAERRQALQREFNINAAQLAPLDDIGRMTKNLKCPFLVSGHCSIYSARPQTCRNYHATDATGCRRSFEEPRNLEIDPDYAPIVYQTGAAHVDAFSRALEDHGYDVDAYELNGALAAALADFDGAWQRFQMKQPVFPQLQATQVPCEFMDLEL